MNRDIVRITAVFRGKNGTMGFIKGKTYDLWMFTRRHKICVSLPDKHAVPLQYDSMADVQKNWEFTMRL